MKIYAKQVPPEYQNSPLFLFDEWPEDVIISGNRDYNEHTTPLYDRIISAYYEAAEHLEELKTSRKNAAYRNVSEIISDFFPALEYREKPYNTRDIHAIRAALELYGTRAYYDGDYIPAMLAAITGREWSTATIRGCCQGDWQEIIYPAEYGREWLESFEAEYFNTGTEWIVDPDGDAVSVYVHGWSDDDARREIADAYGCDPADVVLLKFTGWSRSASYEEVTA